MTVHSDRFAKNSVDADSAGIRRNAAAQALASLRADGCAEPSAETEAIIERWIKGEVTTAGMEREVEELHGL